jgi:hypothetical protein
MGWKGSCEEKGDPQHLIQPASTHPQTFQETPFGKLLDLVTTLPFFRLKVFACWVSHIAKTFSSVDELICS